MLTERYVGSRWKNILAKHMTLCKKGLIRAFSSVLTGLKHHFPPCTCNPLRINNFYSYYLKNPQSSRLSRIIFLFPGTRFIPYKLIRTKRNEQLRRYSPSCMFLNVACFATRIYWREIRFIMSERLHFLLHKLGQVIIYPITPWLNKKVYII